VLVTTSTRIRRERIRARAGRIVTRPSLDCHSQVWFRHAPRGTIAEHLFPTMEEAPMDRLFAAPQNRLFRAPLSRVCAWAHVNLVRATARLRSQTGQGTVEYVALILLVALVMAGVVAALKGFKTTQGKDLGDAIIGKIKDAVGKVQF
jgi:hypothetical protein